MVEPSQRVRMPAWAQNRQARTVLASLLAFTVLGTIYGVTSADRVTARAMVTSSRAGALAGTGDVRPERETADQVTVLESAAIAERAAEIAARSDAALDTGAILAGRRIVADPVTSDLVVVEFSARTAERAVLGADSIVAAYREWVGEAAAGSLDDTVAELDAAIGEATERLAELEDRRAAAGTPAEVSLAAQRAAATDRVTATLDALAAAADPAVRDGLVADLDRSRVLLDTIGALEDSVASQTAESVVLDREIESTSERIGDLIGRREDLRLAASVAGASVRSTPAEVDESGTRGVGGTVAVFAGLGLVFGIGVSLVLAAREG